MFLRIRTVAKSSLWVGRMSLSSGPLHGNTGGSLCSDYTFTRILGTRNKSEPILRDLFSAARIAITGDPNAVVQEVNILDRKVFDGVAPLSKGEVLVDVRAKDLDSNYIVVLQRRKEPEFAQRALLYTAAEIVEQHVGKRKKLKLDLRPVHLLAFCDYDFGGSMKHDGIAATSTRWRNSSSRKADPSKALQMYALQPKADFLGRIKGIGNAHLDREMDARMSLIFALLPHVPHMSELTSSTPPLLCWASLVAHVNPDNVNDVPIQVQDSEGVQTLLQMLRSSVDETHVEWLQTFKVGALSVSLSQLTSRPHCPSTPRNPFFFQNKTFHAATRQDARDYREALTIYEDGYNEGVLEVMRATLAALGVGTRAEYKQKFGSAPPSDVAVALPE